MRGDRAQRAFEIRGENAHHLKAAGWSVDTGHRTPARSILRCAARIAPMKNTSSTSCDR